MGPSAFVDGDARPRALRLARPQASMGPSAFVDGDGYERPHGRAPDDASMGPSAFVDGDTPTCTSSGQASRCFNGAINFRRRRQSIIDRLGTTPTGLQWGHRLSSTETPITGRTSAAASCFNGAIDFRRRRRPGESAKCPAISMLQWGHRPSSMETVRLRGRRLASGQASMGPSTIVDGDRKRSRRPSTTTRCFNGAIDFRRRRLPDQQGRDVPRLGASMGPSTFVDGDQPSRPGSTTTRASFNGAIDFRRRRRPAPLSARSATRCFNGAVGFRRRRRPQCHSGRHQWVASMGPSLEPAPCSPS